MAEIRSRAATGRADEGTKCFTVVRDYGRGAGKGFLLGRFRPGYARNEFPYRVVVLR